MMKVMGGSVVVKNDNSEGEGVLRWRVTMVKVRVSVMIVIIARVG